MTETITLRDNRTGRELDLPIVDGTVRATDLHKATQAGMPVASYDPGYVNTVACKSSITFIDGAAGILRYRGYPIEELAGQTTYLEVAHLLIEGELPDAKRLRAWEDSDAALIKSAAADPFIPLITSVPTSGSEEDVAAYLDRQHRRLEEGTGFSFAIADLRSNRAVGNIGLWTRDFDRGRLTIGYWVAEEFRQRGHAQDALATLTKWAVTLPGVGRLQLFVEPWNEGSWRLAEACGFMREGLLRQWQEVGDRRRDMWVYSLIPDPDDID